MSEIITVKTGDFLNVSITTPYDEVACLLEKRFNKGITVAETKEKLEVFTGAQTATMKIKVFNKDNELVCTLDNDDALLGSYPIDDGMRFHIEDAFILRKELDTASVEKFDISEEEYAKRQDTVKAYLERNRLGKYNKEEVEKKELEKKKEEEMEEKLAEKIKVNDRCLVRVVGQPERRGEVMFVGKTEFKPGWWVGIKLDEPQGKNDGSFYNRVDNLSKRCSVL
ncbi:tubulin-folding cofactor B-like isoform X2 [Macrosteles quadrilineatus]|uniref:tubulin-folding cofactor B-like isoform X2 n=1 Tax=Macrosteles quadrilineatus TaxID=74068 RepID=UPI0023E2B203|nr:tubulin-folding cofactor B-like isoform X2 [Macrosteles quadrilineatus]